MLLSLTAWLISRLSQTYSHTVEFALDYAHLPEGMVMVEAPPEEIGVRIRANGFQLLGYQVSPKKVSLDLREARTTAKGYFISPQAYRDQIEGQLGQGVGLLQIPADTIFMNFQQLQSKTVPVRVQASLDFAQNYMLDGAIRLEPSQVHLLGPPDEIDSILEVHTAPLSLNNVKEDFAIELSLEEAGKLTHTEFSEDRIQVSGKVFRFSETVLQLPVEVVNLPDGLNIQTFPEFVGVLCKGRVAGLKSLSAADFRLIADYTAPEAESGRLMLTLAEQPDQVYEAQLLESSVEFIIRRE